MLPLADRPPVVLCHGLWMPGLAMGVLAHRLAAKGFHPIVFRHSATQQSLTSTVDQLHACLIAQGAQERPVHVIGHSLGGVLAVHLLQRHGECTSGGRVVCLGAPLAGSAAAHWLTCHPWGTRALGQALAPLSSGLGACPTHTSVGMIAGTRAHGAGQVLRALVHHPSLQTWLRAPEDVPHDDPANDGTVWVHETRVPGLSAHILVDSTHTGLTFDDRVAHLCEQFMGSGRFEPNPVSASRLSRARVLR